MKRWISRILVLMLAGLMLTGCIASQAETKLNADGSGTNAFKIGFATEFSEQLKAMSGGEDLFEQPKSDAANYPAEWGAKVSDWKEKLGDTEFSGIQIDMKFADLKMLNDQLTEFTKNSNTDGTNPAGGALANLKVEEVNGEFVVTGTGNATDLAAAAAAGGGDTSGLPGGTEAFKNAVIVWQVTMPGTVKSAEPKEIVTQSGNTVSWKIPADKTATYQLKAVGAKSGGAAGGSLPLILGIVGALVLIGGLAFFFMNRNKKPAAATYSAPPAGNYGQPYDPNAGNYNQPQGGYGQQQPYDPNAGNYNQPQGGYGQQQPYDPNAGGSNPNDPNRRP